MSQRVKKPGRQPADDSQGKSRRRRRASCSGGEEEDRSGSNSGGNSLTGMWTPRHLNDLKVSSIYNRNSAEAPAELYRKDLISAMKLPDSEPLTPEEYWLITDSWKQEWEKGVQVPVNPESLPEPEVKLIQPVAERSHDFRLPKKKYVRVTHDDFFNPDYHQLVSTAARAEKVCSYDLDDVDAAWLGCSNADRAMQNMTMISEFLMEQVIEELELQCWEQVQTILKSQEGLGIEYDENVICDVCRSPESEEGNEMVFCDSCNICVHQACYGITTIPSGSWLCRTCTLGIKPACVLCPNVGGAMKATRSGHTWAHVACAIWIPEVSIGSVEKMEPITKISSIPQSRWSLNCVLCKEKTGACIQCSVKTCKTAYHVTCAFKNGLEMKPIIVDENAEDGIKLRSYCQKHSVNTKKEKQPPGDGEEEKKKLKQMTAEERNQARAEKLQQIEAEFFKYVRIKDVSQNLAVDMDVVILIYNYWKLKRKSLNNRPLVPPRPETTQLLTQQQEQDLEQMKMFVQLRQDLERVRNLCYMVSRREKLSRSFFRLKEQTFQKQLALLTEPNNLTEEEKTAILAANHGPSIYDQLYSNPPDAGGGKGALPDYESLISMIAGGIEQKKETLMNGIIKGATLPAKKKDDKKPEPIAGTSAQAGSSKDEKNPYKKQFVNGASRRKLLGESSESESEKGKEPGTPAAAVKQTVKVPTPSPQQKGKKKSTVSPPDAKKGKGRKPLEYLFESESSVENATPGKKGKQVASKAGTKKKEKVSQQRNKEKDYSSDSDLELPTTGGKRAPTKDSAVIYTDSDEETDKKELKTPTKKAVKKVKDESPVEVTPPKKGKKVPPVAATTPVTPTVPKVTKGKAGGKKGKKSAFDPTELIVPQRMAAKKATESIRTAKKPKEAPKDDEIKEEIQPKEVKKTNQQKVSTLTDSEDEKSTKRKKSVERKPAPSVAPKAKKPADEVEEEEEGEIKDEEEAKNVSYVPQRQAAKKAAEHIRSGLSNIVAARLIIEDEMEATRKKEKKGEGEKSGEGKEEEKISSEVAKKLASKEKPPGAAIAASLKGVRGKGKDGSGTAASSAADAARSATSADWPFLDTGSQSAGRSSRERSSSSGSSSGSSSSSSGSSCSSSRSSSASSSRSSSADSASPEPSPSPPKVTHGAARSSAILATISQDKVASRKVKTSEPSPQPAAKAGRGAPPSREKPASKGGRPSKSGGGRGVDPFRSAFSPSPEPEPTPTATRKTSTSSSATLRASPAKDVEKQLKDTPPEKQRKGRTAAQSPPKSSPVVEKKSTPRRKGEPSPGKRGRPPKSKEATSEEEHSPTKHTPEKRSPPKALTPRQSRQSASPAKVPPPPQTRSGPQLSSESDSECPAKPTPTPKESSLPTITLSDSDSGTEEKENAQRPEPILDSPKKSSSRGGSTPAPPTTSILSPLTPENKEKDSRLSDTEPDSKRPRLESSSPAGAGTSGGGTAHIKSIFSPSSTGAREHDLGLDFDTELYDLAKSVVTEEYRHRTAADDDDSCNEALHFNFTQTLFMQEQNQEESARATLNLVEKLRQQQNMQKFTEPHRPSLDSDGQCDNLDDVKSCSPAGSRPGSSLQGHDVIKVTGSTLMPSPHREVPPLVETRAFSQVTQDKLNASPDRTKQSIEGDERWVPPSGTPRSIPSGPPSHPELGKEDKLSLPLTSPSSYHARSEKGSVMSDSLPSPATPLVASPMVSPLMTSQPQRSSSGSTCSTGLAPPPPPSAFPPNAAAAAAALAVAMAAEASPNNMAAVAAGLPFGAQFMYPALANNPAFASIMAAAAAAAGANSLGAVNPLASFLAKQGPGSPALAYPPFISPVMPPSVPTPQQSPAVPTPPTSQQNLQQQQQPQRRPSDVSPLVSVATSMPPLAKPPLTSPSVLLSTANISSKSQLLSAPPLQSAVAHIIESVVNNHQATSLPKTTLSLDIPLAPPSTNPVPPTPPLPPPTKTPLTSPTPDLLPPKPVETASPQVSPPVVPPPPPPAPSGRGRRASTPRAKASLTGVAAVIEDMLSPPIVSKPSGRRGAKGQSPGRGAKTTPSKRGGASGGRGRGRGKNLVGVRKDLAGTVYDIDFDEFDDPVPEKIDLRSLRERRKSAEVAQQEAKHTPSPLVLTLPVPPSYRQTKEEKRAAKQLEKEKRERERELAKQQKQLEKQAAKAQKQLQKEQMLQQQQQQTVAPLKINLTERQSQEEKKEERILEKIPEKVVLPQAPLPGPVDMRTYSGGEAEIKGDHEGITGLPAVEKDPAVDIAQMFMEEATASTTVASKVVTDFDEVDKELQVLMQKPRQVEPEFAKEAEKSVIASKNDEMMITGKAPHEMPVAPTAEPTVTSQQVSSILNGEPPATMMSHQQQLRPQIMPHIGLPPRIEPPQDNNEDMSRNQLKVKIKGPFLDANYSSTANALPAPGSLPPPFPIQQQPPPVPPGAMAYPPPPFPSQWMMNPSAASSSSNDHPTNLRRMRKKELLRKYWNEDMNMDGGSSSVPPFPPPGPMGGHFHDPVAHHQPSHHPHHPLGRSVITIPKAVASMSILPPQDDHDPGAGDPNEDPLDPSNWKDKDIKQPTQKKRRSRGIYREMAALGILPPDAAPRNERRRDKNATSSPSGSDSNRKRVRESKKPRSTFIPPTLAENVDSPAGAGEGKPITPAGVPPSKDGVSVVNVVNHPTPKLKIKLGELASSGAIQNNTNHSDSDKETPNKKAKGRPPKKRVLSDAPPSQGSSSSSGASSSVAQQMELLKRESMKYREMIMKEYATAEQQEILKLSGTRRGKKKRKGGGGPTESETDDSSVRSKSPAEIKIIDGPKPKLILRFGSKKGKKGKGSEGGSGATSDNSCSSGRTSVQEKISNGLPPKTEEEPTNDTEPATAPKEVNLNNNTVPSGEGSRNGATDKVLIVEVPKEEPKPTGKGPSNLDEASGDGGKPYTPIRLKLSRCSGSYSLKEGAKREEAAGDSTEPPKGGDQCQVR